MADERELSDSEDEDGDHRRDQTNFKQLANKRKASPEPVNGTITTTTTITETTIVVAPVAPIEETTTENGSTAEATPSASETIPTETTEEPITVPVEGEPAAVPTEEPAPKEAVADGMDTSE